MKNLKITFLLGLILSSSFLFSQNMVINDEVGIFLGPTFMQTDYGEAENFSSTMNNTGFGFGIAYIADFSNSRSNSGFGRAFSQHVKLRAELSYYKANFAYDGLPVEGTNSETARFKAMEGTTKLLNLGLFTEVYIFNLNNESKLQPYFLGGISYSSANPSLKSSLAYPSIYLPEEENIFMEKQNVFSLTGGLGTRYKLDDIDVIFEYRFNAFMSDRIEGLDSDFSGDKNNDAQTIFNLGIVFHLY
jgi:hypothetical protein